MTVSNIQTLFNPLVSTNVPNDWLENLATSSSFDVDVRDVRKNDDFFSLFTFKNLWDSAQINYIRQGMDALEESAPSLLARSFEVTADLYTAKKKETFHCIGTGAGIDKVEESMRRIFDQSQEGEVDTSYCFPHLYEQVEPALGWLESRTGSFIFKDSEACQKMATFLNIPKM